MNIEKAKELIGKVVTVRDGTPMPPARFNKKLEKWEQNNFSGILEELSPTDWYASGTRAKILISQSVVMTAYFSVDAANIVGVE